MSCTPHGVLREWSLTTPETVALAVFLALCAAATWYLVSRYSSWRF